MHRALGAVMALVCISTVAEARRSAEPIGPLHLFRGDKYVSDDQPSWDNRMQGRPEWKKSPRKRIWKKRKRIIIKTTWPGSTGQVALVPIPSPRPVEAAQHDDVEELAFLRTWDRIAERLKGERLASLSPSLAWRPLSIFDFVEKLLRPVGNCREWETVDVRARRVVEDAARHFNGVAKLTSCYRSAEHNRRVYARMGRRSTRSQHIARRALDFVVDVGGKLVNKDVLANWVRKHPIMRKIGGVGRYASSIVHVDVGPYRNWDWRRASAKRRSYHRRYAGLR